MDDALLTLTATKEKSPTKTIKISLHEYDPDVLFSEAENVQIHKASYSVYSDCEYRAQFSLPETYQVKEIILNNQVLDADIRDLNFVTFRDDPKILQDHFGYVQFAAVCINFETGKSFRLESDFIPVAVPKNNTDSVKRMVDFVYNQDFSLLFQGNSKTSLGAGLKESSVETLETRLHIAREILLVLEKNYRFFMTNSKFKIVTEERIDRFERLKSISSATIRYMACHPEEMVPVYSHKGVRINGKNYQPERTLLLDNARTYDLYENRTILEFIKTIINTLQGIVKETNRISRTYQIDFTEKDGYVSSISFLYGNTVDLLKRVSEECVYLQDKYLELFNSYAALFKIGGNSVAILEGVPKPSAIFMSIPHYHQVYNCFRQWFELGAMTLKKEQFVLSFLQISDLYEIYVLLKMVRFFLKDHKLESADRIEYVVPAFAKYKNTSHNNCFKFKNESDSGIVTLYYQPFIDGKPSSVTGLFRNTSIPLAHDSESDFRGKYYTPDYVFKIENEDIGQPIYIIADAKFSTVDSVKKHQLSKLVYKYLFSISPVVKGHELVELLIINGKSQSQDQLLSSAYDLADNSAQIQPYAEFLTLTEDDVSDNHGYQDQLLKSVFEKFI